MIRTLIFDLGRTLVPFDFSRGYRAMAARAGCTPEHVRDTIACSGLVPLFESGQVEPGDFVAQVTTALGVTMDYDEFCQMWSSVFLPETLVPEDWIRTLRTRYRTVLLSNTNAIHYAMLRAAYPVLDHFDAYVLSHEVRAMKPDPRIYAAAIAAAGCSPAECFFADDVPEYVEGARQAGIDAVLFEDSSRLRSDLALRGITW